MRKYLVFLCVVALVFVGASAVFASGMENKNNFSADYVRTLNRAAATDSADAAVYNPAGTTQLKDGLHISLNNQYIIKKQGHRAEQNDVSSAWGTYGYEFQDTTPVPVLPSLFLVYKKDQFAGFFAFTIPGGGGTVRYGENSYTGFTYFANANKADSIQTDLKSSSVYYGMTIGGAFEVVKDLLSVAAGGKVVMMRNETSVVGEAGLSAGGGAFLGGWSAKADYKEQANGFGGFIGLNVTPTKELNIGIKYDSVVRLKQKYMVNKEDVTVNTWGNAALTANLRALAEGLQNAVLKNEGRYRNQDLPDVLSLGVSYKVTPELLVAASYTAYFNKNAMWQKDYPDTDTTQNNKDSEVSSNKKMVQKYYDTSHDAGLCIEYAVTKELTLSVGYLYSLYGTNKNWYKQAENIEFPYSNAVSLGGKFDAGSGLNISVGIGRWWYPDFKTDTYKGEPLGYNTGTNGGGRKAGYPESLTFYREGWNIAVGVSYSM